MDYSVLDLIDLISERHLYLRSQIEERWNEQHDTKINFTEWHVLAKLYRGLDTIADITREVHVSRQATHKLIKNLEEKQLIEIYDDAQNKKIKKVRLTQNGVNCYEEYLTIKQKIEQNIQLSLGTELFNAVKNGLNQKW